MGIKEILRSIFEKGKYEKVFKILQKITDEPEVVDSISNNLKKYKEINRSFIAGEILTEKKDIELTRIDRYIFSLINDLPPDIEILINKIKIIINNYGLIIDALEILINLVTDYYSNKITEIIEEYSTQQEKVETIQDFEKIDDYWSEISLNISEQVNRVLDSIHEYNLKHDWEKDFIKQISESSKNYFAQYEAFESASTIEYYPDIVSITKSNEEFVVKGQLFNWLENYLVADYNRAVEILTEIRDNHGIASSKYYEYLAITHLNNIKYDKFVKTYILSGKELEFNRLQFYFDRIIDDKNSSNSRQKTLQTIINEINSKTAKVYHNIAHNYLIEGVEKGRSTKRNIIKRCIVLITTFIEKLFRFDDIVIETSFIKDLILEIDGGSKFNWLEITRDKLTNKTTFDAISKREKLLKILKKYEDGNFKKTIKGNLISEFKKTGNELQQLIDFNDAKKKKFFEACKLGYFIYEDDEFVNIIKKVNQGNRLIIKSTKNGNENSQKSDYKYSYENFMKSIGEDVGNSYKVDIEVIKNIATILNVLEIIGKNIRPVSSLPDIVDPSGNNIDIDDDFEDMSIDVKPVMPKTIKVEDTFVDYDAIFITTPVYFFSIVLLLLLLKNGLNLFLLLIFSIASIFLILFFLVVKK